MKVKYWITFNEPTDFCIDGYGDGIIAPLIKMRGIGEYLCVDNVLKAHATAYRLYRKEFQPHYHGKIGITLNSQFFYSNQSGAVDRAMQFNVNMSCMKEIYVK